MILKGVIALLASVAFFSPAKAADSLEIETIFSQPSSRYSSRGPDFLDSQIAKGNLCLSLLKKSFDEVMADTEVRSALDYFREDKARGLLRVRLEVSEGWLGYPPTDDMLILLSLQAVSTKPRPALPNLQTYSPKVQEDSIKASRKWDEENRILQFTMRRSAKTWPAMLEQEKCSFSKEQILDHIGANLTGVTVGKELLSCKIELRSWKSVSKDIQNRLAQFPARWMEEINQRLGNRKEGGTSADDLASCKEKMAALKAEYEAYGMATQTITKKESLPSGVFDIPNLPTNVESAR